MEFSFRLSRYEEQTREELFYALEQIRKARSRETFPKLWSVIDGLGAGKKVSQEVSIKRRKRYRVYGVLLIGLGVFAIVPGVMAPKELLSVLIVGGFSLCMGLVYLIQPKMSEDKHLEKEMKRIWLDYQGLEESQNAKVTFRDTGIYLEEKRLTPLSQMTEVVLTKDTIFFVWGKGFLWLQKKDLQDATMELFQAFLSKETDITYFEVKG